jgi:hypothetical protein
MGQVVQFATENCRTVLTEASFRSASQLPSRSPRSACRFNVGMSSLVAAVVLLSCGVVALGAPASSAPSNETQVELDYQATGQAPTIIGISDHEIGIGPRSTMRLDMPRGHKRTHWESYCVEFSNSLGVRGVVTFKFLKGSRTKTKMQTVRARFGGACVFWKPSKKWPKGRTTVTAAFAPTPNTEFNAAKVRDQVKIR